MRQTRASNADGLVGSIDIFRDWKTTTKSLNGLSDIETLFAEGFHPDVGALTIKNCDAGGIVYYQADGSDADATCAQIAPGESYLARGDLTILRQIRLFSAGAIDVSMIQHIAY